GCSSARGAAGPPRPGQSCTLGRKLVPTCGVLWGVAAGAHTEKRGPVAVREFERKTGRTQSVVHAYHRGTGRVFPTAQEIALAREPGSPRLLFLNWKPATASWAQIAKGDREIDAYLDRLARHLKKSFPEPFFFTVHHEPEDDVREKPGSGYTAADYAAMFRHVVQRLRAKGVTNLVTVVVHLAYVPLTSRPWFPKMYPGDDVVDWVGFDTYAYSEPGYGHGDFAELMNRRSAGRPHWPGFYNWATRRFPDKPIMVAEWGVWHSDRNPEHKARFYRSVGEQISWFPRIKALVHFDTPHNQKGWDSRVDSTAESLAAYRELGAHPVFRVEVPTPESVRR
ncbi:MAG TPA: glycosyl hydrolase, partial [Pilimelia sp.]|nr:glycosyl hydrolase [Pilimelia sp.]